MGTICCVCPMRRTSRPTWSKVAVPPEASANLLSRSSPQAWVMRYSPPLENACASSLFNWMRCRCETGHVFRIAFPRYCDSAVCNVPTIRAEAATNGKHRFNQSVAACHDTLGSASKTGPELKKYYRQEPRPADATVCYVQPFGKEEARCPLLP